MLRLKFHFKIIFVILIYCFGNILSVVAQKSQKKIIFDHYGIPQGFINAQALDIVKTRNQYVWIGTENGLVRFNGHNFKTYFSNPLSTNSLAHNYVNKLAEDRHNRLWLGNVNALQIFNPASEKFERIYITVNGKKDSLLTIHEFSYQTKEDIMWMCTDKGLFFSQGPKVCLQQVVFPEIDGKEIATFQMDENGILWVMNTFGIYRYDSNDCSVRTFHVPGEQPALLDDDGIVTSYLDKNHVLWLGLWVNGLVEFNTKDYTARRYIYHDDTKFQNGVLKIVESIDKEEEDLLWLATTDGLQTFDKKQKLFHSHFTTRSEDPNGVPGRCISLFNSSTDGMWIGGLKGLHKYDLKKQYVHNQYLEIGKRFANAAIEDICFERHVTKDSIMWFNINYNRFFRYDLENGRIAPIPSEFLKYCEQGIGTIYHLY